MKCECCGAHRKDLKEKRSVLVAGIRFWSCNTCIAKKLEPRAYVILAGRSKGLDFVSSYIKNKRYVGAEIPAVYFAR